MKTHLIIHHSLTRDGQTVSWPAIRHYHTAIRGWRDIGYHIGVELINQKHEVLLGRPLLARGAAAYQRNMNRVGVHVCFIGNFDHAPPEVSMLKAAAPHLSDICEALSIPFDQDHIIPHNLVAPYKTCPGRFFDMNRLIQLIRGSA